MTRIHLTIELEVTAPVGRMDCIAIRVVGGEVTARATDHHSAVTMAGSASLGTPEGQWGSGTKATHRTGAWALAYAYREATARRAA